MAPIKPDLDRFTAIADVKGLSKVLGEQIRRLEIMSRNGQGMLSQL